MTVKSKLDFQSTGIRYWSITLTVSLKSFTHVCYRKSSVSSISHVIQVTQNGEISADSQNTYKILWTGHKETAVYAVIPELKQDHNNRSTSTQRVTLKNLSGYTSYRMVPKVEDFDLMGSRLSGWTLFRIIGIYLTFEAPDCPTLKLDVCKENSLLSILHCGNCQSF